MTKIDTKPDILVFEGMTIKDAMKRMDVAAEGILFVVDTDRRLLGCLTDGDIRRSILAGRSLADSIDETYNKNPFVVEDGTFAAREIATVFLERKIKAVPVVDQDRRTVGYIKSEELLGDQEPVRQRRPIDVPVVIMAGGKGTRLAPFTNVLPKPLIPIGEKTILELIIDEFRRSGANEYYLTINYRGEMIKAYFDCIPHDYVLHYVKEQEFCGTAGSLSLLPEGFAETFIVSNSDIIVKADFADVLEFHKKSKAMLTMVSSIQHHKIPYGVVSFGDGGLVTSLEEKPEISFSINTGVYVLDSACLRYIPRGEVFHMTHLMERLMADGQRVLTYPVNENEYIDVGQWNEYLSTVNKMEAGRL